MVLIRTRWEGGGQKARFLPVRTIWMFPNVFWFVCHTSIPGRTKALVFLFVLAHDQVINSILKVWPPSTATAAQVKGVSPMSMGLIGSTEPTLSAKTPWQVWPLTQFSSLFLLQRNHWVAWRALQCIGCLHTNSMPTDLASFALLLSFEGHYQGALCFLQDTGRRLTLKKYFSTHILIVTILTPWQRPLSNWKRSAWYPERVT